MELTESSDGEPSGSRAGMSTALCSANTPGDGSGVGRPLATRRLARSRWVGLGLVRSRCASTMAPSAAVMSRALVASKGNTYVVKISVAIPVRLPTPPFATDWVAGPRAAWPRPRKSSTTRAIPAMAAASR